MFYLIANFKSNLTKKEYQKYVEVIDRGLAEFGNLEKVQIVFCPSFLYVYLFEPLLIKYSYVKLGVQNVSAYNPGEYTGEINSSQILDYCTFTIIGHSERRKHLGEDITIIKDKLSLLKNANIKPILCVSDPIELSSVINLVENTLVAFEPLEYIGGTKSAPLNMVDDFYNSSSLSQLIYGGSVNLDNFEEFIYRKYINGFLIGKFCLNPVDFLKIIQKTNNLLNN